MSDSEKEYPATKEEEEEDEEEEEFVDDSDNGGDDDSEEEEEEYSPSHPKLFDGKTTFNAKVVFRKFRELIQDVSQVMVTDEKTKSPAEFAKIALKNNPFSGPRRLKTHFNTGVQRKDLLGLVNKNMIVVATPKPPKTKNKEATAGAGAGAGTAATPPPPPPTLQEVIDTCVWGDLLKQQLTNLPGDLIMERFVEAELMGADFPKSQTTQPKNAKNSMSNAVKNLLASGTDAKKKKEPMTNLLKATRVACGLYIYVLEQARVFALAMIEAYKIDLTYVAFETLDNNTVWTKIKEAIKGDLGLSTLKANNPFTPIDVMNINIATQLWSASEYLMTTVATPTNTADLGALAHQSKTNAQKMLAEAWALTDDGKPQNTEQKSKEKVEDAEKELVVWHSINTVTAAWKVFGRGQDLHDVARSDWEYALLWESLGMSVIAAVVIDPKGAEEGEGEAFMNHYSLGEYSEFLGSVSIPGHPPPNKPPPELSLVKTNGSFRTKNAVLRALDRFDAWKNQTWFSVDGSSAERSDNLRTAERTWVVPCNWEPALPLPHDNVKFQDMWSSLGFVAEHVAAMRTHEQRTQFFEDAVTMYRLAWGTRPRPHSGQRTLTKNSVPILQSEETVVREITEKAIAFLKNAPDTGGVDVLRRLVGLVIVYWVGFSVADLATSASIDANTTKHRLAARLVRLLEHAAEESIVTPETVNSIRDLLLPGKGEAPASFGAVHKWFSGPGRFVDDEHGEDVEDGVEETKDDDAAYKTQLGGMVKHLKSIVDETKEDVSVGDIYVTTFWNTTSSKYAAFSKSDGVTTAWIPLCKTSMVVVHGLLEDKDVGFHIGAADTFTGIVTGRVVVDSKTESNLWPDSVDASGDPVTATLEVKDESTGDTTGGSFRLVMGNTSSSRK